MASFAPPSPDSNYDIQRLPSIGVVAQTPSYTQLDLPPPPYQPNTETENQEQVGETPSIPYCQTQEPNHAQPLSQNVGSADPAMAAPLRSNPIIIQLYEGGLCPSCGLGALTAESNTCDICLWTLLTILLLVLCLPLGVVFLYWRVPEDRTILQCPNCNFQHILN